jgi:hypothetical protein
MADLQRKNELELVEIRGDLKLLSEKIEVIKTNDLVHLKKSIDLITKLLWGVGFLILGQLAVGMRLAIWE